MKNLIITYILSRLREASTWRGIIMLVAGGWATSNPEQVEAILPIAIALSGAIGAFLPDKKKLVTTMDSPSNQDRRVEPYQQTPNEDYAVESNSGWGDKS